MIGNVFEHSGVKGMKWKEHKIEEDLSPERITFNQIMMKTYKGPMTPDEQAKFVAERFKLEQQIGSGKTKMGNTMYNMSNEDILGFLESHGTMHKSTADIKKDKAKTKKGADLAEKALGKSKKKKQATAG